MKNYDFEKLVKDYEDYVNEFFLEKLGYNDYCIYPMEDINEFWSGMPPLELLEKFQYSIEKGWFSIYEDYYYCDYDYFYSTDDRLELFIDYFTNKYFLNNEYNQAFIDYLLDQKVITQDELKNYELKEEKTDIA